KPLSKLMRRAFVILLGFLWLIDSSVASADELPLWEAGFGVTCLSMPDYRGSDAQRGYVFPMPYVVYRGEILRWDRKGIYGLLFESDRVQLNINADASVPVKSSRNDARAGMRDLDGTIQIGPSLEICLLKNCEADSIVQVRLPVRAVIATDFSRVYSAGFVVNPQLNFDFTNRGPGGGWNFGFALGPLYATERYHDFYYEVSPNDELPGIRPAYDARGGYSGFVLISALSKRFKHVWFGAFARYDRLDGAVFEDSPLVKKPYSAMAGFGIAWVFGQSEILVHASP
ncbi:MAG TPA: MipA/OmpV family protein, partial [Nitrospirota bacterium]